VSVNIGPPVNDKVVCELSDLDHIQQPQDLKPRQGWTYRGITEVGQDKTRQDKTFIIIILQVQFLGTQLTKKRLSRRAKSDITVNK